MTIQHSLLPDSELHGLKGAATAASGTVPIANGAGSHSWGTPPGAIPNEVVVSSLSDFPTPIASVITLAPNTVYRIAGAVNIGANRLVLSASSIIVGGASSVDSLTSSTTGSLVTANSVNLSVQDLTLSCASGTLFNFTGTALTAIVVKNVVSASYTNVATLTDVSSGVFELCSFVGGNGVSFSGTGIGNIGFINTRFLSFTGTAIDLGTAVVNTITFNTVLFSGLGGSKDILGLAASGNITTRAKAIHCTFSTSGTPLTNITSDDIKWKFDDNFGIANTLYGAQGSIVGSALNTTFAGTGTPTKVNFGAAFVSDLAKRFTIGTDGRFTYIGLETIEAFIDCTIYATIAGGATRQYDFSIAKNGTSIASSRSRRQYDGTNPGASSCTSLAELSTGDYLELFVTANTATTSINVDTASIKVMGIA